MYSTLEKGSGGAAGIVKSSASQLFSNFRGGSRDFVSDV
jgi:hypothetical protein